MGRGGVKVSFLKVDIDPKSELLTGGVGWGGGKSRPLFHYAIP